MASFEFSKEEMYDMIYAAREARIRFKRARTEMRAENVAYIQWDEESLDYNIKRYTAVEVMLRERYQEAFGEEW